MRDAACRDGVARLAATLPPGLRRDLGLEDRHLPERDPRARLFAEFERMRW